MTAMRLRVPMLGLTSLWLLACRADESSCRELGSHIASIAEAEGKGGAGTALAVERECNANRPTQTLVRCMMDAQSLADVDGC